MYMYIHAGTCRQDCEVYVQYAEVPWLIWASFLSLTALHVYANIKAMRALTLTSLNPSRLQLLVDTFYHKVYLIH